MILPAPIRSHPITVIPIVKGIQLLLPANLFNIPIGHAANKLQRSIPGIYWKKNKLKCF